ncbi:MAG: RNA polymerase sigma factor, partial [Anditalea sp.]
MKTFFEATIWPLRNKLYRMAFLWLKDREEAEDAVQEALEKAWSSREMLQKLDNPTGWLVKVVKNQSLQKIREHKRWAVLGEEEDLPDISESPPSGQTRSVELVFRFLKELPEKQQEIFHL